MTLVWNGDDVARAFGTLFHADGDIAKYIDLPLANYATLPYDKVVKDGKTVGLSTYTGYTFNERAMVSLAMVNNEHSEPGTEVTLVWGEEGRGVVEADGRASRAGGNPRHRRTGADRRGGANGLQTEVNHSCLVRRKNHRGHRAHRDFSSVSSVISVVNTATFLLKAGGQFEYTTAPPTWSRPNAHVMSTASSRLMPSINILSVLVVSGIASSSIAAR